MGHSQTKLKFASASSERHRRSNGSTRRPWISAQSQLSFLSTHSTGSNLSGIHRSLSWSRTSFRQRSFCQNRHHLVSSLTTEHDRLQTLKTAWPVSTVEALFLPEFPIRGAVSERDFEILKKAARGAFGVVLQVRKSDSGTVHAMKVLSKHQIVKDNAIRQCKEEVAIQSTLGHHPFIVKCQYKWQNRRHLFIVTDYIPYGDLSKLCRNYGSLPEKCVKIYAAELALTLDFLHSAGVIYRDLKLENILLDEEGHIQLIDFGLARWLNSNGRAYTICGTMQYMAPEILRMEPYTYAVDWWSLGIVIYVLLTGHFPVKANVRNHNEMNAIVEDFDYDLPDWCSKEAKQLIKKLLCKVPQKRIQSVHVLKWEPFFRDINFDIIQNKKISPNKVLKECIEKRKDAINCSSKDSIMP